MPDLSHPNPDVAAVSSALEQALCDGSGHMLSEHMLSEDIEHTEGTRMDAAAAVDSPAHDDDAVAIDASHDESSIESSLTTKSQNERLAQDSHQNLQDMKLIVRVTMVGLASLAFQYRIWIICCAVYAHCDSGNNFVIIHTLRCSRLHVLSYLSRRKHFKDVPSVGSQRRFGFVHGCLHHPLLPR